MFELSCWFCGTAACCDWAHSLLQIILIAFGCCAIAGLILFLIWLAACIENTTYCNKLSCENYNKCSELEARLRTLEKAEKSRSGGASRGK